MRWLIACLLLALLPPLAATEPVRLTADSGYGIDLVPAVQMLDPGIDTADPAAAWAAVARGEVTPLPGPNPSFGFVHGMRWFTLRIENIDHPAQRWQLLVEQPRIDEILIQTRDQGGNIGEFRLGDRQPFSERGVAHRYPNVCLLYTSPSPRD